MVFEEEKGEGGRPDHIRTPEGGGEKGNAKEEKGYRAAQGGRPRKGREAKNMERGPRLEGQELGKARVTTWRRGQRGGGKYKENLFQVLDAIGKWKGGR